MFYVFRPKDMFFCRNVFGSFYTQLYVDLIITKDIKTCKYKMHTHYVAKPCLYCGKTMSLLWQNHVFTVAKPCLYHLKLLLAVRRNRCLKGFKKILKYIKSSGQFCPNFKIKFKIVLTWTKFLTNLSPFS